MFESSFVGWSCRSDAIAGAIQPSRYAEKHSEWELDTTCKAPCSV